MESCSKALDKGKMDTFGEVQQRIRLITGQLKTETDIIKRRNLLKDISGWRRKEEVFWAQRAKVEFLKHRDSNSKWFHAQAQTRRRNNYISRLKKEDGSWADLEDELTQLIVDYFTKLGAGEKML